MEINPDTAEIRSFDDIANRSPFIEKGERRVNHGIEDFSPIIGEVSPEEISRGYASFETWCRETGRTATTRQTRRRAERDYKKALKRLRKQGKR